MGPQEEKQQPHVTSDAQPAPARIIHHLERKPVTDPFGGATLPDWRATPAGIAINRVRNEGIFGALSDEHLARLVVNAKVINIQEGRELRTDKKGIYATTQGKVLYSFLDAAGTKHPLNVRGPGEVFGEMSYVLQRATPQAQKIYIEATGPLEFIRFDPETFMDIVHYNLKPLHHLYRVQCERTNSLNELSAQVALIGKSTDQAPRDLRDRAADWLKNTIGTWRFIGGMTVGIGVYLIINEIAQRAGINAIDKYPYQFLNLIVSFASAYTIPLLIISEKRSSQVQSLGLRAMQIMLISLRQEVHQLRQDLREKNDQPKDD